MPDTPVDIEAVRERLRTGPFSFVLNQVPALCTELEAARAFVKHCCLVAGIDPELPDEAMVQAFAGLRQDLKLNASMLSTQMDKATTALMDLEAAQAENARLRERNHSIQQGRVLLQRHRDAWREYAYGNRDKPDDFLDGNTVGRGQTERERLLKANATAKADALREAAGNISAFDAGLLNDFGGGNVEWWHEYIRSLLTVADGSWRELIRLEADVAAEQAEQETP